MPNITAAEQGRKLLLTLDGVDPITVDPIGARRGRALTEQFVLTSMGRATRTIAEATFIEALGPSVYSHLSGMYVDEFTPEGRYVTTHTPDGAAHVADLASVEIAAGPLFLARDPRPGEPALSPPAIRQEEVELLALAAFYWQTVIGMDGVRLLLEDDSAQGGSLKALSLLSIRLGLSPSRNSSQQAQERSTSQAPTAQDPGTASSSMLARLPGNRRSRKPKAPRRQK